MSRRPRQSHALLGIIIAFCSGLVSFASLAGAKTQDVNVVNTPDVLVGNPVSSPVPVRDVDRVQPIQVSRFVNLGQSETIWVPPGKRFVIEFVSSSNSVESSTSGHLIITTNVSGSGVLLHFIPFVAQQSSAPSLTVLVASQTVKIFADGGTDIEISFSCGPCTTALGGSVTLSGYLGDIP